MPPSPNSDELAVWRHFQNGRHGNWQNHVFAYNSTSRVDRNEILVSTPIFLRVRNSMTAFTGFYDFIWLMMYYLCDAIFKMAATEIGKIMFFAYNSASKVDRNEISVPTPIFLRVGNSTKALTSFYGFYLTHDELPVWCHFQNCRHENWRNHVFCL